MWSKKKNSKYEPDMTQTIVKMSKTKKYIRPLLNHRCREENSAS